METLNKIKSFTTYHAYPVCVVVGYIAVSQLCFDRVLPVLLFGA